MQAASERFTDMVGPCGAPFVFGDVVVKEVVCLKPVGHKGWHAGSDDRGRARWTGDR